MCIQTAFVGMEFGTNYNTLAKELDQISARLSVLHRLQYKALQKSSYIRMSKKEADEYDRRRMRIGQLCALLAKFRAEVR